MKKNPNHPTPGSRLRVEPIRRKADIQAIKELLRDHPRNYCLFTLGVNSNLRISTLLKVSAGMVRHLNKGDRLEIYSNARRVEGVAVLNGLSVRAIQNLLASRDFDEEESLFMGERGVLTPPSVNRLVKKWCREINLRGKYGSHSLRKTFGYQQRMQFGVDLHILMRLFRHQTKGQTLRYLSLKKETVRSIFENEI